ncbi:hypothetical protein R3P38DRAFT_2760830 [Favolaschia claudopus]|uniref:Uncharacterized protein n=1 Tax=Favolaschia claudopus TaxID=2862362 RepID=A0AAW0DW05_9AGAR
MATGETTLVQMKEIIELVLKEPGTTPVTTELEEKYRDATDSNAWLAMQVTLRGRGTATWMALSAIENRAKTASSSILNVCTWSMLGRVAYCRVELAHRTTESEELQPLFYELGTNAAEGLGIRSYSETVVGKTQKLVENVVAELARLGFVSNLSADSFPISNSNPSGNFPVVDIWSSSSVIAGPTAGQLQT